MIIMLIHIKNNRIDITNVEVECIKVIREWISIGFYFRLVAEYTLIVTVNK